MAQETLVKRPAMENYLVLAAIGQSVCVGLIKWLGSLGEVDTAANMRQTGLQCQWREISWFLRSVHICVPGRLISG